MSRYDLTGIHSMPCHTDTRHLTDARPVQYLFDAASLPSMNQMAASTSSNDASFQTYRNLLQRQIAGRTPVLDDVLSAAEKNIETLHKDFDTMKESEDDTRCAS